MNIATRYKRGFYVALSLAGVAYFAAFSQLDVSLPFLKGYAAVVPMQLAALIYVGLYIRNRNLGRSPKVTNQSESVTPVEVHDFEIDDLHR
ncbi:MAG: hypothetical protein WBA57_23575 [Elainellaceae cyanobacterium]